MRNLTGSSKTIKNTMKRAKDLQQRYKKMGAPGTQNVRNPLPMRLLVLEVLPMLPLPYDRMAKRAIKLTSLGKKFAKGQKTISALRLFGKQFWEDQSLTTEEIVNELRNKGFITNDRSVKCAISTAMQQNNISFVDYKGNRNDRQRRLYFAVAK